MIRMHRLWGLAAVLLAAGCLREKVQYCNNGALCPEPLVCTERTEEPFCGSMGQVEECLGKADETPCTVNMAKGVCDAGLCKPCEPNNGACIYEEWVAMQTPVSVDLSAVWVAGPRDVYASGKAGTVIHWDGAAWTVLPTTGQSDLKSIAGASGTDIWTAGTTDVYHWNGTTWTGQPPANFSVTGMWAAGPNDFFSSGFKSTIGRYTGGPQWVYTEDILNPVTVTLNGIWGANNTDVFAVGNAGTVLHSQGGTWMTQTTPATHTLLAVGGSSSSNVYAVGRTGAQAPIVFHYDGSWQDQTANLPPDLVSPINLRGVWGTTGHVFAVGDSGKIVHSTNDGASWTTMATAATAALSGVSGSGKAVFAVGATGTVLRYQIP